jgi:hypothetical protein
LTNLALPRVGFDGVAPEATGLPIIHRDYWGFTFTATSIVFSRAGGLNVKLDATLK